MKATPANVLFLSGTSSTGKSALALALQDNFKGVKVAPNLTREAYTAFGLKTERQGIALGESQRGEFEHFVLDFYCRHARQFISDYSKSPDVNLIVFRHSPLDHLAYTKATVDPGWVNGRTMSTKALKFIKDSKGRTAYFPYPTIWSTSAPMMGDKFRHVDPKKDQAVDIDLLSLMSQNREALGDVIYMDKPALEDRLLQIITTYGLELKDAK